MIITGAITEYITIGNIYSIPLEEMPVYLTEGLRNVTSLFQDNPQGSKDRGPYMYYSQDVATLKYVLTLYEVSLSDLHRVSSRGGDAGEASPPPPKQLNFPLPQVTTGCYM